VATDIENIGSSGADFTDSYSMIGAGAINVKTHFGATGNGSTIDTAALQAALDASVRTEDSTHTIRGGVYFPPGEYLIDEPLILRESGGAQPQYQGHIFAHARSVRIVGNFNGFLFDNPNPNPPTTNTDCQSLSIKGLSLKNTNGGSGAGCIRIQHTHGPGCIIRDCYVVGHFGILLGGSIESHAAIDSVVDACHFQSLGGEAAFDTGSIGLGLQSNCRAYNCSFMGWDVAAALYGGQAAIQASRIEVGNIGVLIGQNPAGDASGTQGGHVKNMSFESNRYDIYVRYSAGMSIEDIVTQGNQDGDHDSQAALYIISGENTVVKNFNCNGTYDLGGFYVPTNNFSNNAVPGFTFINARGSWGVGEAINYSTWEQINSNLGVTFSCTIANLPTYARAGMRRTVTNSAQAVGTDAWGTAISGTGANTVPVWYDGSAWRLG
jgi:hypothetical protein